VLGIKSPWNWVTCEYPFTSLDSYDEVLPLVVPAYLVWLAQQEFRLPESNSYVEAVLYSLVEWIKSLDGQAEHLQGSTRLLSADQGQGCRHKIVVQRFVDLLGKMLQDGYVGIGLNIARGMVVDGDKVFLPKNEINRTLRQLKLPTIDRDVVTLALKEEAILHGEEDVDGIPVWSLDPAWWKKTNELWLDQRKTTSLAKLNGVPHDPRQAWFRESVRRYNEAGATDADAE
jgi:hypothetical protein